MAFLRLFRNLKYSRTSRSPSRVKGESGTCGESYGKGPCRGEAEQEMEGQGLARLPSRYVVDLPMDSGKFRLRELYGLIRFNIETVDLKECRCQSDYFVTVSVGKQVWTSKDVSCRHGSTSLKVNAGAEFVLEKGGASIARLSLFRRGTLEGAWKNYLEGWCELDLAHTYFGNDQSENDEEHSIPAGTLQEEIEDNKSSSLEYEDSIIISETITIVDPENSSIVKGTAVLSGKAASLAALERQVWSHLLALADFDGNGTLSKPEFDTLMHAFGAEISEEELSEIFDLADTKNSGHARLDDLANVLSFCDNEWQSDQRVDDSLNTDDYARSKDGSLKQYINTSNTKNKIKLKNDMNFSKFLRRCPIDGAELSPDFSQQASNLIYVWLALSASKETHEADLRSGYHTESEAAAAWVLRLSEWASQPFSAHIFKRKLKHERTKEHLNYSFGLHTGERSHHIIVYDRSGQRMIEEAINPVLTLAMRKVYQSKIGRKLMKQGLKQKMVTMSVKEGIYRSSPESIKDIKPFVDSFRGQIDIEDCEKKLGEFKSFNDFFTRKLKPAARKIAAPENSDIIVSAADSRLITFDVVSEATRFWVKGRNFSIAGLLGDTSESQDFANEYTKGTMAIFRLAPQDYHRFHSPIQGIIRDIKEIPGDLLTVNPIAVNSVFHDVFTRNKRQVCIIDSSFGPVAFVAIGATLVGTIRWSVRPGDSVQKGDEMGYFEFGGSTCIALFPDACPIYWDGDLRANASRSLETLVKMGERIGARADSDVAKRLSESDLISVAHRASSKLLMPSNKRPDLQRMISGQYPAGIVSSLEELDDSSTGSMY